MELIKKQIDDNFSKVKKRFALEDGRISPEEDEAQQDAARLEEFKREMVRILVSSDRRGDGRAKEKLASFMSVLTRQARIISSTAEPQSIAGLDQFKLPQFMLPDPIKLILESAKSEGSFEAEALFSSTQTSTEASLYATNLINHSDLLREECIALGIDIENDDSNLGFSMTDKSKQDQYGIILPAVLSASIKSGEEAVLENDLISSSIMVTIEGNVSSENQ